MLKKIFLPIIIFSICSCNYYRAKHITKQKKWEDYLPGDLPGQLIKSSVKTKRYNKAIEDGKIDPKRKVGDKWIDSNGKRWVQRDGFKMEVSELKLSQYTGWWIYGEGQHIFKDEESLEEWSLEFPNENLEELEELYLAVCEMEYFPMECEMIGHKKKNVLGNQTTLIVSKFNILYVQGCGE